MCGRDSSPPVAWGGLGRAGGPDQDSGSFRGCQPSSCNETGARARVGGAGHRKWLESGTGMLAARVGVCLWPPTASGSQPPPPPPKTPDPSLFPGAKSRGESWLAQRGSLGCRGAVRWSDTRLGELGVHLKQGCSFRTCEGAFRVVGVSSRIFCRERREPEVSLSYNRALPVYSGRFDPYLYCQRRDNGEMKAFKPPVIFVSNQVYIFISVNPLQ